MMNDYGTLLLDVLEDDDCVFSELECGEKFNKAGSFQCKLCTTVDPGTWSTIKCHVMEFHLLYFPFRLSEYFLLIY